jgi:hypothetical protein
MAPKPTLEERVATIEREAAEGRALDPDLPKPCREAAAAAFGCKAMERIPANPLIASYCNAIYSPTAIIGDWDRFDIGLDDGVCCEVKKLPPDRKAQSERRSVCQF